MVYYVTKLVNRLLEDAQFIQFQGQACVLEQVEDGGEFFQTLLN